MNNPTTAFTIPTWLNASLLQGMQRGIEKESLRMQADGYLSKQPHPAALGAALTHPNITTDYSEALLELITPPLDSPHAALDFLKQLHIEVQHALPEGEMLWPLSMPCMLGGDDDNIPLAQYGHSNIGKLKTLYRRGLGVRYGRKMQTIAGIHYNLSFPQSFFSTWQQASGQTETPLQDFINQQYFGLIRNFMRLVPLVIYLLGASPAVCACFLKGRTHHLQEMANGTLFLPYATALRMGDLGYQNSAQRDLGIHYNNLPDYITGIRRAIATPFAPFMQLGLDDENGEPLQINGNVLQIENEYYSPIRPKQITASGESPSQALKQRGIAYIELRAVDLDPFSDIGIQLDTACFLETLALYAILTPSPPMLAEEEALIARNQANVVNAGRDPALALETPNGSINFHTWAMQHLQAMQPLATLLDNMANTNNDTKTTKDYTNAILAMQKRLEDTSQTPSAKVLAGTQHAGSAWKFGAALAQQYAQQFLPLTLPDAPKRHTLATQSLVQANALATTDTVNFTTYLQPFRQ